MSWKNGVWVADERQNTVVDPKSRVETEAAAANQLAVGAERMSRITPTGQPPADNSTPQEVNMFAQGKLKANGQRDVMDVVNGVKPNFVQTPNVNPSELRIPQGGLPLAQQQATKTKKVVTPDVTKPAETRGADFISSMFTPPEDEERMRKVSLANMKILALGNALRHIGNIYNTNRYAPVQQFNSPEMEQYQRYMQGKAVRDAANRHYMAYQQQRAAQDAKQRQWEADYQLKVADAARKAGMSEAQIKNWQDRLAEDKRRNDLAHGLNKERLAWQKQRGADQDKERARHNRVSEGQMAQRINLQKQRFEWQKSGGGHGSNVPPLDSPGGKLQPNGRNYGNQLLQMWDYAEKQGLITKSDAARIMQQAGLGKDTSDNLKRSEVLRLLRTNPQLESYAITRLGWTRGGASGEADDWSDYMEDDWDDYAE